MKRSRAGYIVADVQELTAIAEDDPQIAIAYFAFVKGLSLLLYIINIILSICFTLMLYSHSFMF